MQKSGKTITEITKQSVEITAAANGGFSNGGNVGDDTFENTGFRLKRTSCCSAVIFSDSGWNGHHRNQTGEIDSALAPSCPSPPTALAIGNT